MESIGARGDEHDCYEASGSISASESKWESEYGGGGCSACHEILWDWDVIR